MQIGSDFQADRFIKERHLLGCRLLKSSRPFDQLIATNGRLFNSPALNPVEQNIDGPRQIMQFDRSAKCACSEAQRVSFRPAPCAPFDGDDEPARKEFLGEPPLQGLDLSTHWLVPEIDGKGIHPIVR